VQLFYNPDITESTEMFAFPKEESKHILRVLRKKEGDILHITNGKGWLLEAKIKQSDIKNCKVEIVSKTFHKAKDYTLHLAVAPTKMNDRYEWFLEKATEIGLDSITPIICDHSERKVIKRERFEKIIQSAMKQSLHFYLPKLNDAMRFSDFIKQDFSGQRFIAHCEDLYKKSLKKELKSKTEVTIIIGPEGDFSVKEIKMALQHAFIPLTLGETRLRTETAAVVACHSVAYTNE